MRAVVVAALREEIAPLARRLNVAATVDGRHGGWHRCDLETGEVFLIVTGDGPRRARESALRLVSALRPDVLIGLGSAGALTETLGSGDLVAVDRIVAEDSGRVFQTPESSWAARARSGNVTRGTAVTARAIASRPSDRERLARLVAKGPAVVDLESAFWAEGAELHDVPFVVLRGVIDTADETLPLDFERLRNGEGDLDRRRVLWAACRRPAVWPELLQLRRRLRLVAERLASACMEILAA